MTPALALPLFEKLYSGVAGYALSHAERSRLQLGHKSVIYGEVVPAAFHRALAELEPREGEVFFDLGSGTGKAVFWAALCFGFSELVGVELLGDLNAAARAVLARFDAEVRPALPEPQRRARIHFADADLRQVDVSRADVVFLHSVCFERPLVSAITLQLEQLRPGARVLSVGQRLASPELAWVKSFAMELAWGEAFAWLYRRR